MSTQPCSFSLSLSLYSICPHRHTTSHSLCGIEWRQHSPSRSPHRLGSSIWTPYGRRRRRLSAVKSNVWVQRPFSNIIKFSALKIITFLIIHKIQIQCLLLFAHNLYLAPFAISNSKVDLPCSLSFLFLVGSLLLLEKSLLCFQGLIHVQPFRPETQDQCQCTQATHCNPDYLQCVRIALF